MNNIDQTIYNIAKEQGFSDVVSKMIVAQARVETATNGIDYTTNNFKCNNNLFGMKFVGQPLARRGTLAPSNEISSGCIPSGTDCNRVGIGNCKDGDYYARYNTIEDSARDAIERLFNKTINGITPEELNSATDSISYATLQKKRGYYGFYKYGEAGSQAEIDKYAAGIRGKMKRVSVTEWISDIYKTNKVAINYFTIGAVFIGLSGYFYYLYKKGIILKK